MAADGKSATSTLFAEVAVSAPDVRGARTFHYSVPGDLETTIAAGQLVVVGFGRRQLHGIVTGFASSSPVADTKPILDVAWEAPLLHSRALKFLSWLAETYGAPLSTCLGSLLPANIEKHFDYSYSLCDAGSDLSGVELTPEARKLVDMLRSGQAVSGAALSKSMGKAAKRATADLMKAGLVARHARLSLPSVGVRTAVLAVSVPEASDAMIGMARAPKRQSLLKQLASNPGPTPVTELLRRAGASWTALKPLVEAGLVKIETRHNLNRPGPMKPGEHSPPDLGDEASWGALQAFIDREGHGVGLLSGEPQDRFAAYARAVERVAGTGRQVLTLAPTEREAEKLYDALAGRVGGQVEFFARARTPSQRVGLWRAIRAGEVDVLVGARSAVFAPLSRLGLIIVEREEDRNYKDRRGTRVQARDAAIQLGRLHSCPVVLGSETPSVETFHEVEKERYRFILIGGSELLRATRMKVGRGWGSQRPAGVVDVVDMRAAPRMGHGGMISEHLHSGLARIAAEGGRAVLFVNRRGSASLTVCQDCGYTFGCKNCSTNLVQHRLSESLVCHVCNQRESVPRSCPDCGSRRLRLWGHGTEAVVETLKRLFPGERVERIDGDVPLESIGTVADGFRRGAIRFLVGTTMLFTVADFLTSGLLGVVQADLGLGFPDYTAPERVFQTLMRLRRCVVGGGMDGRMIVQTIMPQHHVVEAVRTGSYLRFFRPELEIRRAHEFPPLRRLARFVYAHKSSDKARIEAETLVERLRLKMSQSGAAGVQFMGPAPAFRYRERGKYRWHIMALGAGKDLTPLIALPHRGWIVDADPVDMY